MDERARISVCGALSIRKRERMVAISIGVRTAGPEIGGDVMKVLVIGSTGGSGRAVVEELGTRGHQVTAFTRRADAFEPRGWLTVHVGDVMDRASVDAAVAGHDAVIVTLGIAENALAVRLRGSRRTPMNVRSAGTRHVIEAMQRHSVDRLVVQTTYGQGDTAGRLTPMWRLAFGLVLEPQIRDTGVQEQIVRDSGLDWVLVQPVSLTDDTENVTPFTSVDGETAGMKVSRTAVACVHADAATSTQWRHLTVSVSTGVHSDTARQAAAPALTAAPSP
jgi:hypothetical protein